MRLCAKCSGRFEAEDFTFESRVCDRCYLKHLNLPHECVVCGMPWTSTVSAERCCNGKEAPEEAED